ncbi:MAG: YfhO family protein [Candidatus Kapabacteria bacterium]|nr:YfhO family protein [Candidatus Kapabacteria bacterium]
MAKLKANKPLSHTKSVINTEFTLIPEKYQDWIFIGLIALLVFIFFGGVVTSYEIAASDNFASISFRNYLADASKSGEFPQWVPYIFGGMPSYASMTVTGDRIWDFTAQIFFGYTKLAGSIFANDSIRVIQFYIIFGIGMYLLMRAKKHAGYAALFTALAAVFSTGIIHWIMIGHNTKPITMAVLPFIFLLMEKLIERFKLIWAVLLVVALHLMLESAHVQMMFYSGVAVGVYLVFELISRIVTKNNPLNIVKVIGVMMIAGGLAFSLSSDRYLAIQEYTPYSVRGSAPIADTKGKEVDNHGGNSYEYATMWSFSPEEVISFFVPSYYGYGKLPYSGPATRGEEVKLPTYWGQKVFEDVPPYMGILVLFLAIYGFVRNRKDVFVQSLLAISIFILFLSFGSNLPVIYDFFFYYVPSFNKFRAPSMALAIMQFAFPILAGYGLTSLIKEWKEGTAPKNLGKILLGTTGGFLALGLIYAALFKSFYISAMTNSANQSFRSILEQIPDITDFVWGVMIGDWLMIGAILFAFGILSAMLLKNKISLNVYIPVIILLLLLDLWTQGWRPLEITKTDTVAESLQKNDVVEFLQNDKSTFRIADFAMASISPNLPAYYRLENIGGYHPAKLRVYQDMLDVADQGSTNQVTNPFLWNLLNVKYIISPQEMGPQPIFQSRQNGWFVYANPAMFPRAFFVDSIKIADPLTILKNMKEGNFDPSMTAFLESKPKTAIEPAGENATVEIVSRKNEYIKLEVNATGNNLIMLSEIYYPLWKAFIDGNETEILKTNYAFRSIIVPQGKHTIEMKLESKGFATGKMLSIISNILLAVLLAAGLFIEWKKKKE